MGERSVIKVELLLLREYSKSVKWTRLSLSQSTLVFGEVGWESTLLLS